MSLTPPVNENDHVLGPPDAPVTLVEYGDYQCPYCRAAYYFLQDVFRNMGDDLRFVFRNMPLSQVHPMAEIAAEAAEAAGAQGQFWKYHDGLYEHQPELSPALFTALADAIGLDLERFADDLRHHRFRDKVKADFMSAVRSGAAGTPTFFINGERYVGAYDADSLTAALREAASMGHGRPMPGSQPQQPTAF